CVVDKINGVVSDLETTINNNKNTACSFLIDVMVYCHLKRDKSHPRRIECAVGIKTK
ncbi:uncharacterized protein V6R79_020762, partial [Siganus canaliculatus]